jgi:hypothetical protein
VFPKEYLPVHRCRLVVFQGKPIATEQNEDGNAQMSPEGKKLDEDSVPLYRFPEEKSIL